jgi:hypothetical protein
LIATGHPKSLSQRPNVGVRTVGSWRRSASTSRCASGTTASSTRTKWWIVYCFEDAEHAEKFRMRFGGEQFNPKHRGRGANWARWYKHDAEHLYCRDVRTVHSQLHVGANSRALSPDGAGGAGPVIPTKLMCFCARDRACITAITERHMHSLAGSLPALQPCLRASHDSSPAPCDDGQ